MLATPLSTFDAGWQWIEIPDRMGRPTLIVDEADVDREEGIQQKHLHRSRGRRSLSLARFSTRKEGLGYSRAARWRDLEGAHISPSEGHPHDVIKLCLTQLVLKHDEAECEEEKELPHARRIAGNSPADRTR